MTVVILVLLVIGSEPSQGRMGTDTLGPKERASLAGMISYITGFEPDFINVLIMKYGFEQATRARSGK